MKNKLTDNIKLGIFVLAALAFIILLLYMIGKNSNMFGDNYILKARFENVQGLKAGNNVRYAGIDIGTVKSVYIINDTTVEIKMIIDSKANHVIRKTAVVNIGTDGLVGNKVVNITPSLQIAPYATENDILPSKKPVDTDEMLRILSKTNIQVSKIAVNLNTTIDKLNNSNGLWQLLQDKKMSDNISQASFQIKNTTIKINDIAGDIEKITNEIKNGNGTFSKLLNDKSMADSLTAAIQNLSKAGNEITTAAMEINNTTSMIGKEIVEGKGTVHTLMKDSVVATHFSTSMKNIETGTKGFSDNMEALKHNFLFRGYFRKMKKQNKE